MRYILINFLKPMSSFQSPEELKKKKELRDYLAACEIIKGRVDIDDTEMRIDKIFALKQKDFTTRKLLIKEGWIITHDPYSIDIDGIDLYIDLGAEKLLAAEKDGIKIAIEIKSFVGLSIVSEFHTTLGQFLDYKIALEYNEPDRTLYIAVTKGIYEKLQKYSLFQTAIQKYSLIFMVFDPIKEDIIQWKN